MASQGKRHRSRKRAAAVAVVALAGTSVVGMTGGVANASSHREAPLTAGDPQHDNTDVYAFTSPDKPDTVTLIANWIPFEEPNGGPNFYPWKAGSHYDINIDNSGTGKPDITYRWTFSDQDARGSVPGGGTFLYNNGQVKSLTDKTLLFKQTYTLTEIKGGKTRTLVSGAPVAPSDVGPASMPNYAALRNQAITSLPGGAKTFAGQAADPFFLDLRVFDLLYGTNLKETGQNTLAGYNVNTIALQVPKSALALKGDATRNPVIGVWSTTEKQTLQLSPGKATPSGNFVQVSRLGNPLVNEVVIPAQLKDAFNGLTPDQDHTVAPAVAKVLDPEVPKLIQSIYGIKAPAAPRKDLAEIFLTGVCKACGPIKADLNSQLLNRGVHSKWFTPAEELRLNTSVPVTANPNRLGVLAKDLQGFPNGRRLSDDVVDIELQALEGAAQTGTLVSALAKGDGVDRPASPPGASFPYVVLPNAKSVNLGGSNAAGPTTMATGGGSTGSGSTGGSAAALPSSNGAPVVPVAAGVLGMVLLGTGARSMRRRRPAVQV